jgi:membrane protein involved in colicin uptake
MAKVREMSDEDFASYKEELVSIRAAVVSELEKAREKAEADAKAEEEAAKKAAEEAKNAGKDSEKEVKKAAEEAAKKAAEEAAKAAAEGEEAASEEESVIPAQITPGQATAAALNMEYIPGEDVMAKYAKLGQAMAAKWKKSEE